MRLLLLRAENAVPDIPKTYASYHDAKKDADALTRERDQKKRQFTQMYGWRTNAAALPGYAEAQDELDSLNARLGAALDFMSTHTAELADGHSAIHIQGDAAGYEERVAAMRQERDAYAAGDQVDPSKLYRMDRQLARWQKAVDKAKEAERKDRSPDARFVEMSFDDIIDAATEDYVAYMNAQRELNARYGDLEHPEENAVYRLDKSRVDALEARYHSSIEYMMEHYSEMELHPSFEEESTTAYLSVYQEEADTLNEEIARYLETCGGDPVPAMLADYLRQLAGAEAAAAHATIVPDDHVFDEAFLGNYAETRTLEGQFMAIMVGMTAMGVLPDALNVMYAIDHWNELSFRDKLTSFAAIIPYIGDFGKAASELGRADDVAKLIGQTDEIADGLALLENSMSDTLSVMSQAGSTALVPASQAMEYADELSEAISSVQQGINTVRANMIGGDLEGLLPAAEQGGSRVNGDFSSVTDSGIIDKATEDNEARSSMVKRYMSTRDQFFKNVENVPELDGYYDIACHADAHSFAFQDPDTGEIYKELTAAEFAERLRADGNVPDVPIRFFSCESGQINEGLAQQLANELNIPILAPTKKVYTNPMGYVVLADDVEDAEVALGKAIKSKQKWSDDGWILFKPIAGGK